MSSGSEFYDEKGSVRYVWPVAVKQIYRFTTVNIDIFL